MLISDFQDGLAPWWRWYGNDPTEGPDIGAIKIVQGAGYQDGAALACDVQAGSSLYLGIHRVGDSVKRFRQVYLTVG